MDSMNQGDDQSDIDSARDFGTMLEVERGKVRHDLFDGPTGWQQFGLCCHGETICG